MSEPRREKLTKTAVDRAAPGERDYVLWDAALKGFGVRVSPKGVKVFIYQYRVGGGRGAAQRKARIGRHGSVTVAQARAIAEKWAAEVAQGGDPAGQRQESRTAPKMADLFKRYLEDHARPHKKPKSIREDENNIRLHLSAPLAHRKIADVSRDDIDKIHKALRHTPYLANRILALLSKMFQLAEVWGLRPEGANPCRHVTKFKEQARERYLSPGEFARLGETLIAAETGAFLVEGRGKRPAPIWPFAIHAVRLLIFTGARLNEILALRWDEVRLDARRLELTDSKTGRKTIFLSKPAVELLAEIPHADGNPHVIVGKKPGAHLVNLKDPWLAIRAAADLDDVRLHDLRHSFASMAVSSGMSLPMIGALLGHRNTATTQRYAHLADDPLRAAAEKTGFAIQHAFGRSNDE